jgi:NADH:ubiquinone oxidoreductase subunit 6 (subunit J)
VGLALLIAAVVGAVVLARRNPRATAVLVAFLVSYAAAVSLSPLHWDRYVIPMIPVLAICGAIGLSATLDAALLRLRSTAIGRRATMSAIATTLVAILYLAPGFLTVAHDDRLRSLPSTRVAVTDWVRTTLPKGVLICEELYTTYEPTDLTLYRVFSLADHTLDDYRNRGCAYLISSSAISGRFTDAHRYPSEAAFYATLSATGQLVETFSPGPDAGGSEVRVYLMPRPA